jgi:ferredoxin
MHRGAKTCLDIRTGLGFQAIAEKHATPLEFDCREADCGICIFKVLAGGDHISPPTARETDFLRAMRAEPTERLACQARVHGPATIEIEHFVIPTAKD